MTKIQLPKIAYKNTLAFKYDIDVNSLYFVAFYGKRFTQTFFSQKKTENSIHR